MIRVLFLFAVSLFYYPCLKAQVREKITINNNWQFLPGVNNGNELISPAGLDWEKINIPHTWNAADIIDETPGYRQGIGWYKKMLFIEERYKGKQLELFFEAVCNKASIFINNKLVYTHSGGFTGFRVGLTDHILFGQTNEILVKADNSKYLQDSIPPFSGDFNLMGGIYRDVWFIATNQTHFTYQFGSEGILFETPRVSREQSAFTIRTFFYNNKEAFTGLVEYQLFYNNTLVKQGKKSLKNSRDSTVTIQDQINNPRLWSPEDPALYRLVVQLKNKQGVLQDEVSQNIGFKWTGINDKKEFMLNGSPYKLKGASRHQDYKNIGNALPDALHVRDIELMKEMGCNFIRIAHYPQDPAIYEACNQLGLIAWSEIPVVDKVVNNEAFFYNSKIMMQEMIFQNFNHPCIAIWGYHNEVRNLDTVSVAHATMLNRVAKQLDPQRLTAIAFESNIDAPYFSNPLLKEMLSIADINGYNVYQGWYRGRHDNISSFLDTLYAYYPKKPIMLSEYGAGSIINIHSNEPTLFDFSEEYQCRYHESYVSAGNSKPWMLGFAIWNFIDFQRDGREDVVPHINKKGMVTTDRIPKDVFYFYKSQWSKEPFIYITGKNWPERTAFTGKQKNITVPVTVYSNFKELILSNNGVIVSRLKSDNGIFKWMLNMSDGQNQLLCKTPDEKFADHLNINAEMIDSNLAAINARWQQLHFNTGQSRSFFTDAKSKEQWMPDKPYSPGTWGYVNGSVWNDWPSAAWNGIREGIHKPIAGTENDAVFQTFVQDLTQWKADVPAGSYRISVLIAEPFTLAQRNNVERIFDISLNNQIWKQQLNPEKEAGIQSAIILEKIIRVKDNEGILLKFDGISGKTILNGVSIYKL